MLASHENLAVELNVTAPPFILQDIFDRSINLKDYKGKRVFIGFFVMLVALFATFAFTT